ncbi:MAG: ribonuclease III [Ruminococcus sp.]|nr:ribonuclease III [Ruminococcus sp.]
MELTKLEEFEQKLGYTFKDKDLLIEALTHSSYANESHHTRNSNERLEFLGDSVLSIVVSEYLFEECQDYPEGELSKTRATLVCEKSLAKFAEQIDLKEYIYLGKGELSNGGKNRPSIISDAFEAVIAAVYLDGGFEVAKKYVLRFIPENVEEAAAKEYDDYKTVLQEIIQKNPEESVEYELVSESGPAHRRSFTVDVMLNSNVIGTGTASSKKRAEQLAAKEALKLMGTLPDAK